MRTLRLREALHSIKFPGLNRNLFSSPPWLNVLEKAYGVKLYMKYIQAQGSVRSYVIYSVVNNFLEKKICICSYCDYCDALIGSPTDWQEFFASFRSEYPDYRIAIRNLRDRDVLQNPNFTLLSQEKFHILDIRLDLETIWKKTHESFRSAVKQAQKSNVQVRKGTWKDLKNFYALHLELRRQKYHIFPQPFIFFKTIWQEYVEKEMGFLLCAFDSDDRLIAGTIYLECGNTLYYKVNTSALDALKLRPNNLLFWEGIKIAKEKKCEYIDMGSSGFHQKGLILFKDHTGASSMDINHLGFHPPGYKFSQKRILGVFTKTFTAPWLPRSVVQWGSQMIYPYLA